MKVLGFYKELWTSAAGTPEGEMRDFTQSASGPDEGGLTAYLHNGHQLWATMGAVEDILGSGESILGGNSLYTDGEFVWRGDLWFYVYTYHLRLPAEFIAKARNAGFTVPQVDHGRLVELTREVASLL